MKMNHADILRASASKVNELDSSFGPRELVFDRAARIATILLDKHLTAYDVSMITTALNLAHMQGNRSDPTNYVSAIVNVALAGQFAIAEPDPMDAFKAGISDLHKGYAYATNVQEQDPNATN
jgi:citrate lyase beta subunit